MGSTPRGLVSSGRYDFVAAAVELLEAGAERGLGPFDLHPGRDGLDGQGRHRGWRSAERIAPLNELRRRARIDDAGEADPGMGGRAHGAMLAGRVDGRAGAVGGAHVFGSPAGEFELGMAGLVTSGGAVVILAEHSSVSCDED